MKSMGPGERPPGVLKELADVVSKALSIIFEKSQQSGKVQVIGNRETAPIFQRSNKEAPGN